MNRLRHVLHHIDEVTSEGETAYLKSRGVADAIGCGAREVGCRMGYLRDTADVPVAVENWSSTGSSTTYAVTVEDSRELQRWLTEQRGEPEPALS